jgi:signal transduction histidine kinase
LHGPADQNPAFFTTNTDDILYHFGVNVLGIVVVALLAGYLAERLRLTGGQLVEAEERAKRAERLAVLGGLASGLAHEIRNPLGSIGGSIRLLSANRNLSEEERLLCDIIQRETNRLNELVTDMVDLARVRVPEFTEIDVATLVQEVVVLASASGRAASDVAVRYVGPSASVTVSADEAQLRQLVWNLVRNAVQASSAGAEVRVFIERTPERGVLLGVEDDGPGIDPAVIPRLFDPFYTTRSHGSGIGLAVVRRIADEHGFEIAVSSRKGQGARFTVVLGPSSQSTS